ncbi:MAG TPA: DUF2625 domain-containing protein [Ohtaekwangia sp.]|uniref:DUF2625 domain-containing protein n=1 Tax=Ohtaekwangia sp. TaxID=2066019 RepID=UPI002F932E41
MNKILLSLIFLFLYTEGQAQKMRDINELINNTEPGWVLVKQWIDSAKNRVEVLPCDSQKALDALYKIQVTTRSPMGAIVHSTGGILVDHGWIRILGSGSKRLNRALPDWNKGKSITNFGEGAPFLLIADDAIGGFFAINGGEFGEDIEQVYYLAPDNLMWESLDLTYSDFLSFCFYGDLADFYRGLRWSGWEKEVSQLDGNMMYNFYPPLWTKEGKDITKALRKAIAAEETYGLTMDVRKQLRISK